MTDNKVTLRNRTKRMQVFNLHPGVYRGEDAVVRTDVQTINHNPRTGEKTPVQRSRNVPGSITFLAEQTRDDLDPSILACPEVLAAIERRDLVEVKAEPSAAEPQPAASPSPASKKVKE